MTLKIHVDMEKCQHYGQCVFDAPNIFRLNDDDKLEYEATADDSERAAILERAAAAAYALREGYILGKVDRHDR